MIKSRLWYDKEMKTHETVIKEVPIDDVPSVEPLERVVAEVVEGDSERRLPPPLPSEVTDDMDTPAQKVVKEKLVRALGAEARFKLYAEIMDDYGVDPLLGLIPAGGGDVGAAIMSGTYFTLEGVRAKLSWPEYVKMICWQAGDKLIGLIPWLGDVLDLAIRANTRNTKAFERKVRELEAEARYIGVENEEMDKLRVEAVAQVEPLKKFLQSHLGLVKDIHKKVRGVLGGGDKKTKK